MIQVEVEEGPVNNHCRLWIISRSNGSVIDRREVNILETEKRTAMVNDQEQSRQIGLQLVKSFADMLGISVVANYAEGEIFIVRIEGLKG